MSFRDNKSDVSPKEQKDNSRSLQIVADISEILADHEPQKNQRTPAFKNKEVINFYEGASEDMSMLKDITALAQGAGRYEETCSSLDISINVEERVNDIDQKPYHKSSSK